MHATDDRRLDHPVYAALTGAQARFAESCGRVVRYPAEIAPFLALPPEPSTQDWVDAAELVPLGSHVAVPRPEGEAPAAWEVVREFSVVQMVEDRLEGVDEPEAIPLGRPDVPEMVELVRRTDPGPFLDRTIELGRYLGIRRGGALIAMAGERFHFDGWREISAVCTAPTHRGQGLASRLVGALRFGIHRRSERAFLHVVSTNANAIGLYEQLGFKARSTTTLTVMTPHPATPPLSPPVAQAAPDS